MQSSIVRFLPACVRDVPFLPAVSRRTGGRRPWFWISSVVLAVLIGCGSESPTESGPPQGPTLSVFPDTVRVKQFGVQQISASLLDSTGTPLTSVNLAFTSQDPTLVVVSTTGVLTSVGPAGRTSVTVGGAGLTAVIPVFVWQVPTTVQVTPPAVRVGRGGAVQLSVIVLDAVSVPIADPNVMFATDDSGVATVTPDGIVTGVGLGTTVVTATSGDAAAATSVEVVDLDSSIVATTPLGGRPFGVAVAASGAGYVVQLDLASMARITLPGSAVVTSVGVGSVPTSVAIDPAGVKAYVANQSSQSVSIVDVASNTETGTYSVSGDPFSVAVEPDGSRLWVTLNTNVVEVIDLSNGQSTSLISVGSAPGAIVFHPSEPLVYVSAFYGGTVSEINTDSLAVTRTFTVGGVPQGLAMAPDGSELYIANEALGLQVWDPVAGTSITTVNLGGACFGLAMSPDGTRLAVTQPASGRVRFVNRTTRAIIKTVITGGLPRRIAFGPGGTVVVVPNEGGWFDVVAN